MSLSATLLISIRFAKIPAGELGVLFLFGLPSLLVLDSSENQVGYYKVVTIVSRGQKYIMRPEMA